MKCRPVITILALAMSFSAVAAEKQSEQSPGSQQRPYISSLAVVMQLIQLSHFKLWLAGNLRNWRLAEYELLQMKTTLQDARTLFPNVPKAVPAQPVDATQVLNLSAGVSNPKVFRGRSFS